MGGGGLPLLQISSVRLELHLRATEPSVKALQVQDSQRALSEQKSFNQQNIQGVSNVPSTSNTVGLSPRIPLPLGELERLERIFCSLVSCQFECQEMSPLCKIN